MAAPGFQPQYRLIEQALRMRIATLQPGARLPSDAELCAEFGVSRMTARHAMQRLADEGLVAREPGRGSFVAEPAGHRQANRLMSFSQEMLRAGRTPSSRVLTREVRPASPMEARELGIQPDRPVVHLRRLRLADDTPVAIESAVLVGECADTVMDADLARGSLHEALGRAGIALRRGTSTISSAASTPEDARLLRIPTGAPLLVERRFIVDTHGRRVEVTESRYLADRYALVVHFDVEASPLGAGGRGGRARTERVSLSAGR
jgi:GntR family transcriptional regulator